MSALSEQHFHPSTAELVAAITATQRRMAEVHVELDDLIAEVRERIAHSRQLLAQADKVLAHFDDDDRA